MFFPSESLSDTWMCLTFVNTQERRKERCLQTRYNLGAKGLYINGHATHLMGDLHFPKVSP